MTGFLVRMLIPELVLLGRDEPMIALSSSMCLLTISPKIPMSGLGPAIGLLKFEYSY